MSQETYASVTLNEAHIGHTVYHKGDLYNRNGKYRFSNSTRIAPFTPALVLGFKLISGNRINTGLNIDSVVLLLPDGDVGTGYDLRGWYLL
jgi:hypothetical protein